MNIAEQYLLDSETNPEVQDIDFTVVLPGGLTKKPVTGIIKIFLNGIF